MTDTLTILATLGANEAVYQDALLNLLALATVNTDLYVVIDEASDAQVQHLLGQLGFHVLSVTVDASPHRRGLVAAYNAGFTYARRHGYGYVQLLEEGVRVTHGWDTAMRRTLDAHPEFGWVACGQKENPAAPFTALCSLLHREALLKVEGLDPLFAPDQFDDGDLFMRLRGHGYMPHAVDHRVLHPVSRTSRNGTVPEDVARMWAHKALFAERHGIPDMPWASVPVHAPCEACTAEELRMRNAMCAVGLQRRVEAVTAVGSG